MAGTMEVFDRRAVRRRRDRAARLGGSCEFLFDEVAGRLVERLDDFHRSFARPVVLGARTGHLAKLVAERCAGAPVVACDLSEELLRRAAGARVVADEEALPFRPGSVDLVVAGPGLHAVNDLPGALVQIRRALGPDGLFLAAMLGGETLCELRRALLEAEAEHEGGASPRVAPFTGLADAGALLQRAGFALPVVDLDTITVTWPDALSLMRELRGMGETNALAQRRRTLSRRTTLLAAAARYESLFADAQGRVPATFQVLFLTAWAPGPGQQRPLVPGSAEARLADALRDEAPEPPDQAG